MLITAYTLIAFYIIAAALAIGGYASKNEGLLAFGASLFILTGWIVFTEGISEQTGLNTTTNYTQSGNLTTAETATTTYNYDQNKGILSNSLGALSLVFGATLFFYLYEIRRKERQRYERGE